jgi:hypothetical protein
MVLLQPTGFAGNHMFSRKSPVWLQALWTFQNQRHRSVIDERNFHQGSESAGLNINPLLTHLI